MHKSCWFISMLLALVLVAGCSSEAAPSPVPVQRLTPVGPAQDTPNNLVVRTDWVKVGDAQEIDGSEELHIDLLVVRSNESSRRLQAPGVGVYRVKKATTIDLADFALTINDVQPDETILLYWLAIDQDETDWATGTMEDVSLDFAAGILGNAIAAGRLGSMTAPTHIGLITFILSNAAGAVLDYWQQADVLDGAVVLLDPSNDTSRLINQRVQLDGDNGYMTVQFALLDAESTTYQAPAKRCLSTPTIMLPTGEFDLVPLRSIANDTLGFYGDPPEGLTELGNVPFCIDVVFGTQGDFLRDRPESATLELEAPVTQAQRVFVLVNSGATFSRFAGDRIGSINLHFSDSSVLSTPLVVGDNIREWQLTAPDVVNHVSSQYVQEVFGTQKAGQDFAVLDMLEIPVPSNLQLLALTAITFTDSSQTEVGSFDPGFFIAGVTVATQ